MAPDLENSPDCFETAGRVLRAAIILAHMNASKITVRLDAEQRTADIEVMTLRCRPRFDGLGRALEQIGIRPLRTEELDTARYRVTRSRLAERDGSQLTGTRVMQILCAAREIEFSHAFCTVAA